MGVLSLRLRGGISSFRPCGVSNPTGQAPGCRPLNPRLHKYAFSEPCSARLGPNNAIKRCCRVSISISVSVENASTSLASSKRGSDQGNLRDFDTWLGHGLECCSVLHMEMIGLASPPIKACSRRRTEHQRIDIDRHLAWLGYRPYQPPDNANRQQEGTSSVGFTIDIGARIIRPSDNAILNQ